MTSQVSIIRNLIITVYLVSYVQIFTASFRISLYKKVGIGINYCKIVDRVKNLLPKIFQNLLLKKIKFGHFMGW